MLHLFDTRSRRKQPFVPANGRVGLYVCGVTPYDTTHLGHAFTYVAFDVLVRLLRFLGDRVRYVQNVTDVDDDILRRARELRVPWDELARDQTERYRRDMADLNVLPPDVFPKATEEVPAMIELAIRLEERGHTYRAGGNLYFRVASDPGHGRLSRLDRPTMLELAAERGGRPDDPAKLDPLDFVLWQAEMPGEPSWPSPWGPGRPGWHLECSTMALKYLGAPVDLHGGGEDLVFPHHECEIAQAEAATGTRPFVRTWLHTGMVRLDGEKMSKSLGNMVFVRDLLERYSADAIRLYLLGHHYRAGWDWEAGRLNQAARLAARLAAATGPHLGSPPGGRQALEATPEGGALLAALLDDLDTPRAMAALAQVADRILTGALAAEEAARAQRSLLAGADLLGLRLRAGDTPLN